MRKMIDVNPRVPDSGTSWAGAGNGTAPLAVDPRQRLPRQLPREPAERNPDHERVGCERRGEQPSPYRPNSRLIAASTLSAAIRRATRPSGIRRTSTSPSNAHEIASRPTELIARRRSVVFLAVTPLALPALPATLPRPRARTQ